METSKKIDPTIFVLTGNLLGKMLFEKVLLSRNTYTYKLNFIGIDKVDKHRVVRLRHYVAWVHVDDVMLVEGIIGGARLPGAYKLWDRQTNVTFWPLDF